MQFYVIQLIITLLKSRMDTIIIILSIIVLSVLSIPLVFNLVLTKILGFSIARLRIRNPFHWIDLLCHLHLDHWALKHVTFNIPKIVISINFSPLKLVLQAESVQAFAGRRLQPLNSVNLIDGAQQSAILSNLDQQVLKCLKINFLKSFKKPSYQQFKQKMEDKKLSLVINAFLYFVVVILMQFLQIKIKNTEISLVSFIPENQIAFISLGQTLKTLKLMQCLAEYTLLLPQLIFKVCIKNGSQQEFEISCAYIKGYTCNHSQQQMCILQDLKFYATLPFSFSFQESIRRLSLNWQIKKVKFNTVPKDFQDIAELIRQMLFQPQQLQTDQIVMQEQRQMAISVALHIENAQLTLKSLYEPDHDDNNNFEYLSNIESSTLSFKSINLSKKGFNISQVRLWLCKGIDSLRSAHNQHQATERLSESVSTNKQFHVLKIPNIQITEYQNGNRIQINHSEVQAILQKQELALLGKLFRIINSRTKFEQYDWPIYMQFVEKVQRYNNGQLSLISFISQALKPKQQFSFQANNQIKPQFQQKKQKSIVYAPQVINISLHINKLIHKCQLPLFKYTQEQNKDRVNHQLYMQKIIIEYKNIKEFTINQFKLLFTETGIQQSLSIFVQDIHTVQNEKTLVEYLVGFTLFKSLLQLNASSFDQEESNGNGKRGQKLVQIKKITLNYATQTAIVRTLLIKKQTAGNGYLQNLSFSLAKCELQLNSMVQTNKKLQYVVPSVHTLVNFQKLSLTMYLVKIDNALKQKVQIHLKSPTLVAPQVNVGQRVSDYIETLKHLSIYIEAYLKNVTDEKLQFIKHRLSSLVEQPDLLILKVTDLVLAAQDSFFDIALLNHFRLIRQYLSRNKNINHVQLISQINHQKRAFKLFEIHLGSFTLDYQPIKQLVQTEQGVVAWIDENLSYKKIDGKLSKVTCFRIKGLFKDLTLRIRDYPMNIVKLDILSIDIQFMDVLNVYTENQYFAEMKANLGKLQANIGLNLLSGFLQVIKKVNSYIDCIQGKGFQDTSHKFKQLHQVTSKNQIDRQSLQSQNDPYWKVLHKLVKWNASIQKPSESRLTILTDSHPYSLDGFEVIIGKINALSRLEQTKFEIQHISVMYPWAYKSVNILQLHDLGGVFKSVYEQPYLKILTQCNIGKPKLSEQSKKQINRLMLSKNLIQYLSKMKQLRADWLTIYGLVQSVDEDQQIQTVPERLNYLQIANIAANKSLKKGNKEVSIISVLKAVQWKFQLTQLQINLSNSKTKSISLFTDNLKIKTKVAPDAQGQSWTLHFFRATLDNAIARLVKGQEDLNLFYSDYKQIQAGISEGKKLSKLIKEKELQSLQGTFLVGRKVKFTARSYLIDSDEIYYVGKKFQCDTLKGQMSVQLKKTLQRLIKDIVLQSKLIVPEKAIKMAEIKRQRFRKAVKLIMRINRKKKKKIPSFDIIFRVKNISVALKTDTKQVIVGCKTDTLLKISKVYDREDKFHIDPKRQLTLSFDGLEMWIQKVTTSWVFQHNESFKGIKIVSSNYVSFQIVIYVHDQMPIYVRKQSDIKMGSKNRVNTVNCIFQSGHVHLTAQTSNMLKQIVEFIIKMTDPNARKQKVQKIDGQKYFQILNKGKNQMKTKLAWAYSDAIKKDESLKAKFSFQLDQMNIVLEKPRSQTHDMFMKIQSNKMKLNYNIYNNGKQQKRIEVHQLLVINMLEDTNSNYRNMLQMNQNDKSVDKLAVVIVAQNFELPCFYDKVFWDYYQQLRIHFNPLKFKMTQQAYQQLDKFFFGNKKQQEHRDQQEEQEYKYSNNIPDYFKKLLIDQVKVQIWYRTDSVIKRMDGISVGLQTFQQNEWFVSRKQLFQTWLKFVLKQLAGQFFNVIGQKLFG